MFDLGETDPQTFSNSETVKEKFRHGERRKRVIADGDKGRFLSGGKMCGTQRNGSVASFTLDHECDPRRLVREKRAPAHGRTY